MIRSKINLFCKTIFIASLLNSLTLFSASGGGAVAKVAVEAETAALSVSAYMKAKQESFFN